MLCWAGAASMMAGQTEGNQRTLFNLRRYFVKAGTPAVLAFVKSSPFSKKYFSGKKVHRL